MAYQIRTSKSFDKAVQLLHRRGYNLDLLFDAIDLLRENGCLPSEYKPHKLSGKNCNNVWECHIGGRNSDWLLLWTQNNKELWMIFTETGTHSDLFG
ncbi:MAG: type II toxin-antitoxin system YafQ family toxin [Bacteroidales bacterium]|nr:type II toxin-antitoxin system YafQ family toxin [Bacteroidales bacterium]